MKRRAIWLIALIVLTLASNAEARLTSKWLNNTRMYQSQKITIDRLAQKYSRLPNVKKAMARIDKALPIILEECRKGKTDPETVIGRSLVETGGRQFAVCGAFWSGGVKDAFVGPYQEGIHMLPANLQQKVRKLSYAAREAKRRHQTGRYNALMAQWYRIDPRFRWRESTRMLCAEDRKNNKKTGDKNLTVNCWNGGFGSAKGAVKIIARENGNNVTGREVARYVQSKGWNGFLLLGSARVRQFLHSRGNEDHDKYLFPKVATYTEVYNRHLKKKGICIASASIGRSLANLEKPINLVKKEDIEMNLHGVMAWIMHYLAGLWSQTAATALKVAILAVNWLIVILLSTAIIVGLRHIVPFVLLMIWSFLRWGWANKKKPFQRALLGAKLLLGSSKQRAEALKTIRA